MKMNIDIKRGNVPAEGTLITAVSLSADTSKEGFMSGEIEGHIFI